MVTIFLSRIVGYGYRCPMGNLMSLDGYWSSYTNYRFSCLKSSVLVITKQQKSVSSSINTNITIFFTHLVGYGYFFPWDILYFYGLMLVQLHQFLFLTTQIHCLGDHKIVGNLNSSINMNNYHYFPPVLQSMYIMVPQGLLFVLTSLINL